MLKPILLFSVFNFVSNVVAVEFEFEVVFVFVICTYRCIYISRSVDTIFYYNCLHHHTIFVISLRNAVPEGKSFVTFAS